jgi:hypothetical protein
VPTGSARWESLSQKTSAPDSAQIISQSATHGHSAAEDLH